MSPCYPPSLFTMRNSGGSFLQATRNVARENTKLQMSYQSHKIYSELYDVDAVIELNQYGAYVFNSEPWEMPERELRNLPVGVEKAIPDQFIQKKYCPNCHHTGFIEEQNKLIGILKKYGTEIK